MKRGFTLIELLAVITLLIIILTITFSVINNVLKDSRENTYETQISTLENAAKRYISDNIQGTKDDGSPMVSRDVDNFITIKALQKEGYINSKSIIKNPKDERTMTGCVVAAYSNSYHQFQYVYTDYGCMNEKIFTPKITITKGDNGKYNVTIKYPNRNDIALDGISYVYRLGKSKEDIEIEGSEVTGLSVTSGTKITAEIKRGDYLVRQITEIA